MKKIALFLTILLVSLTLFGQTGSPTIDNFLIQCQEMNSKCQEHHDNQNFQQVEVILKELLTLVEEMKLSEEEIAKFQSGIEDMKANIYYNLSCTYSLLNQKKQALESLEKSVALGYNDYFHILEDTDLDNIRKEKRFVALLEKMSKETNLSTLQQAEGYEKSDTAELPQFFYEEAESARLQDVKKLFKLDSIAGNGDEISKILNIMYWIHNNIRHDGSSFALAEFDAIDLYNYHKATITASIADF